MNLLKQTFFLAIFFIYYSGIAQDTIKKQTTDTTKIKYEVYTFKLTNNTLSPDTITIDTSIQTFQIYNSAIDTLHLMPIWLGNLAQPATNKYNLIPPITNYFARAYLPYLTPDNNVLFYDTHSFYTNLFYYTNGSKELNLQSIQFLHTQNINKHLNFAVKYKIVASDGLFQNQKSKFASLILPVYYHSSKYKLAFFIKNQQFKNHLNGGLQSFNYFNTNFATINFPVNLSDAYSKNRFFSIKAQHNIKLSPNLSIRINNHWFTNKYYYSEKTINTSFYHTIYLDTTQTNDSAFTQILENSVIGIYKIKKWSIFVGGGNQTDWYINNNTAYNYYINNFFTSGLYFTSNKLSFKINSKYYISGYYSNNYQTQANLSLHISKKILLNTSLQDYLITPSYFYQHLKTNHSYYNLSLSKIKGTQVNATIGTKSIQLLLISQLINNYLYIDTLGIPQEIPNITLYNAIGTKIHIETKHFGTNNTILYQSVNNKVITLPQWQAYSSVYYKAWLVKNVLQTQIGIQANIWQEYTTPSFFPATSQFTYSGNHITQQYPYIDIYINFKLKRARFFFIMQHINYSPSSSSYFYTIYPYPLPTRTFRFGISWNFYDKK